MGCAGIASLDSVGSHGGIIANFSLKRVPSTFPAYFWYNDGILFDKDIMPTLQITLSEPMQQFVLGKVAELGLDRPDQYVEKLLEEEQHRWFDDYCMEKVQKAIDRDEWIAEDEFWQQVDENTRTRRNVRKAEAVS